MASATKGKNGRWRMQFYPPGCRKRQTLRLVPQPSQSAENQWQIVVDGGFRHQRNPISWDRWGSRHRVVTGPLLGDGNQGHERALNAKPTAKTAKKTTESHTEMKNDKFRVPRITGPLAGESVGVGQWKAINFSALGRGRPPFAETGSHCAEENPMMELTSPVNPLADVLGRLLPLLPLAERWLEKQVGEAEVVPRASVEESSPSVKEWYTPDEAGPEINRTPNHVRELCRKKIFGKRDAGGRWVINRKELEAFRLGRFKVHGEVFK